MERDEIKSILTNEYNNDTFLFHYTSLDACCSIIESKQLRMGNLANTNDPLEFCGVKVSPSLTSPSKPVNSAK